jgi:hypothetical protein
MAQAPEDSAGRRWTAGGTDDKNHFRCLRMFPPPLQDWAAQSTVGPADCGGKKNGLFVGGDGAGERGLIFFTVIEACLRRGVDPFEYLRAVFERMPTLATKDEASRQPEA